MSDYYKKKCKFVIVCVLMAKPFFKDNCWNAALMFSAIR